MSKATRKALEDVADILSKEGWGDFRTESRPPKVSRITVLGKFIIGLSLTFLTIYSIVDSKSEDKPNIKITHSPPTAAGGDIELFTIAGTASGPNLANYRVVVYAQSNKWYVQPYSTSPFTEIQSDGTWEADTHFGRRYAALLVRSTYNPPAVLGTLPEIGGDVLAIHEVGIR